MIMSRRGREEEGEEKEEEEKEEEEDRQGRIWRFMQTRVRTRLPIRHTEKKNKRKKIFKFVIAARKKTPTSMRINLSAMLIMSCCTECGKFEHLGGGGGIEQFSKKG